MEVSPHFLQGVDVYVLCVCVYAHTHTLQVGYSDVSPGVGTRHLESSEEIQIRSMLSPAMLGNIHQKLCRGYKKKDVAFGGIRFLILYGDDGQLPPPCATPLYDRAHAEKTEVERIGKLMYINIQKAVY